MKKLFDNKAFKVIYTLFRICFVLMIVLYLSFIIVQRMSGNKSIFGYRLFNVATGSMAGVYDINDVIVVKDCDTKKLKVGDDIAYRGEKGGFEGLFVTHRIIKIERTDDRGLLFTTQGVKAPTADPVITESQILGKVVGVVPVISFLNHLIKSQLGFFLLVFCPLVLVIVLEVLQTITEIKLEKNEIQKIEKKSNKKKEKKEQIKEEKINNLTNEEDNKEKQEEIDVSSKNEDVIKEIKVENNGKVEEIPIIKEEKMTTTDSGNVPEIVEVIEDNIEIL